MLNRIGYSLLEGGYGVLGKMGSQSSLARFVMAHARGNLHPTLAYYFSVLDVKENEQKDSILSWVCAFKEIRMKET